MLDPDGLSTPGTAQVFMVKGNKLVNMNNVENQRMSNVSGIEKKNSV